MSVAPRKFAGRVTTIFNGQANIAPYIIARLGKMGSNMVVAHRGAGYDESKTRISGGLGQMVYHKYHLQDEDSLREAMCCSDTVINLIGSMQETRNFSYEEVHIEGARRIGRIARECGVKKLIHFSALNAQPHPKPIVLKKPSRFLMTKYYGELALKDEFPDAVIFRPAPIICYRDNFFTHYTSLLRARFSRYMAIWDYYDGVEKQPVWVNDVVSGVVKAMEDDSTNGKIIQAVGPYRYDFFELIEYMRSCAAQSAKYNECEITNLRWDFIMRTMITVASAIHKKPFCNWERVEVDSHSDYIDPKLPTLKSLGVELSPLELEMQVMGHYRPRFYMLEIPYQSALKFDLPRKLNVERGEASSQ